MKNILHFLLIILLLSTLSGCGCPCGDKPPEKDSGPSQQSSQPPTE